MTKLGLPDRIQACLFDLDGKPAPDAFLAEHFGFVVGVDRAGQAEALRTHGADVVVSDLAELIPPQ